MMNFRKGDKVKFLNDVGQGEIVRFQDKDTAIILNEDGFEVPVLLKELLKMQENYVIEDNDSGELKNEGTNEKKSSRETGRQNDSLLEDGLIADDRAGVYFAVVPKNQNSLPDSDLDAYLINDSNFRIMYTVSKTEGEFQSLLAYGELESNTKIHLFNVAREDLPSLEELYFQVIFYGKGSYHALKPLSKFWNTKPSRFFKQNTFTENDFFNEKAYIYEINHEESVDIADYITEAEVEAVKKQKEKREIKKQFKSNKKFKDEEIEEVDLHIGELVEDYGNLSNSEILDIQKGRFITALEGGIISGTRKMVFIHGVGNGRLKHEIIKTLERKYPKIRFQDASFKEYGYGATMVILK